MNYLGSSVEGSILFVNSHGEKVNLIAHLVEEGQDCLYLIELDRSLEEVRRSKIKVDDLFFDYESLTWLKPVVTLNQIQYPFVIKTEDRAYMGMIDTFGPYMTISKVLEAEVPLDKKLSLISDVVKYQIEQSVLVSDKLYFIGTDGDDQGSYPVYGICDLSSKTVPLIYGLYSDVGEIYPLSITVSKTEPTVIIGGYLEKDDKCYPYLEKFFYRG